jgi:hypothetical protein
MSPTRKTATRSSSGVKPIEQLQFVRNPLLAGVATLRWRVIGRAALLDSTVPVSNNGRATLRVEPILPVCVIKSSFDLLLLNHVGKVIVTPIFKNDGRSAPVLSDKKINTCKQNNYQR